MTELKTILTIDDVLDINALLDMEQDIAQRSREEQEAKANAKRR